MFFALASQALEVLIAPVGALRAADTLDVVPVGFIGETLTDT